jgi:2-oxo-3-hexenedioate decarboxylase
VTPEAAAAALAEARDRREAVTRFTDTQPTLDQAWGYAVQDLDRAARVRSGEAEVGAKLGLTSRAKQITMQVDQPIIGFLTDAMDMGGVAPPDPTRLIQPRVEPEIAFVLGAPLASPLTRDAVPAVVADVAVAVEVLDSRYTGYRFRLPDVLADNTSAAGYLLSDQRHNLADAGDLAARRCRLRVDGEVVAEASGSAILGDPLQALVRLSDHLAARGRALPAGSVVLAGAMTDAVPFRAGSTYQAELEGLGSVTLGS